jgi:hypothetical protein
VLLPENTVVPVEVTLTIPAVALPPFAIVLAMVVFPAPAIVRVRLVPLPEEVRLYPPLKTNEPPATELMKLLPFDT